jgi:hypothetical protein
LAEPGKIGYRELPETNPQDEAKWHEDRRTKALEALRAQRESLTVELSERGKIQTAAPSASDEEERLRREVEELERLKASKQRLDDRDEWRQQKSAEFREKFVERPPPKFVPAKVETRVEEARQKKLSA